MSTVEVLTALQSSALGHAIAKSDHLVGATAQIFHVLGFVFLLAAVIFINLRLAGLALPNLPVPQVAREPKRLIWLGLAFAIVSGVLMFLSAPLLYFANPAFILKIWLLVAAIVLQLTLYRHVTSLDQPKPIYAKLSVLGSIVLWFGVGLAGRAIGFV